MDKDNFINVEKVTICKRCEGKGVIQYRDLGKDMFVKETCPKCEGHGTMLIKGILYVKPYKQKEVYAKEME